MATAALLVGGTILSSAIGARESRRAGETQAGASREAAAITSGAFREAAPIEAGGIRQAGDISRGAFERFAGVERQAGEVGAAGLREAAGTFQPFAVGGAEAAQQEAALSGALGPQAQQAALDAQVDSPFIRFIEQRGRQQIGQGFAATGGLGGGERLKALTEFGQDVATQSLSQQLQNLRNVRQGGFNATTNIADLISRAGGVEAGAIRGAGAAQLSGQQSLAQAIQGAAGAEAFGIRGAAGAEATGVSQAGTALAQGRLGAANQIQQGVGGITNILALQNQGLFNRPPSRF